MAWPEDSAGGIMSPVAFRLGEDTTCREAIEALHEQADVEMVFYVYVLNDGGQLVGICSLRNLLLNPPSTPLNQIMTTDVVTVSPETDQEEVAATTLFRGDVARGRASSERDLPAVRRVQSHP